MDLEGSQRKTPADYNRIAQLTEKGLSSDFKNYFSFKMPFQTFALLKSISGKEQNANNLFNTIVRGLTKTPTYSEKYLNENELKHAAEYGVIVEDLINSRTEPALKD